MNKKTISIILQGFLKHFKQFLYFLLSTAFVMSINITKIQAEEPSKLNVLIVFSWDKDLPWQAEIEKGFVSAYKDNKLKPNIFYEYMDAGRFDLNNQIEIFKDFLEKKYAGKKIDYIIIESIAPTKLFIENPELLKDSKRFYINPGPLVNKITSASSIVIPVNTDYDKAAKEMLRISQGKEIYLVAGASKRAPMLISNFSKHLLQYDPHKKFSVIAGLPMDALLEKVSQLDKNSIIFYLLIFQDGNGVRFVPFEAAKLITQHSSVPVYSLWSSLMGSGIVGGYQQSGELLGYLISSVLINPETAQLLSPIHISNSIHGFFYDWNQLKKWDIDEKQLPPGSRVLYRQPSFYEEHLTEIIISSLVFILIVSLFWVQFLKKEIKSRKKITEEKKRLIVELRTAFEEIHTLQGIIPICSSCKKIRDDKGYWNQIEEYISTHTDSTFSHGICPDCVQKLYPEYADEIYKKASKENE